MPDEYWVRVKLRYFQRTLDSSCMVLCFSRRITLWSLGIGSPILWEMPRVTMTISYSLTFFSEVYINLHLLNITSSSYFKTLCIFPMCPGQHFCAGCYYHSPWDSAYFLPGGHLPDSTLFLCSVWNLPNLGVHQDSEAVLEVHAKEIQTPGIYWRKKGAS